MADRMKNDDLDKNMGGGQRNKDDFGQQTPGRKQQDDLSTGQRGAGQGQRNEPQHIEDDFGTGGNQADKSGFGQSDRDQNR